MKDFNIQKLFRKAVKILRKNHYRGILYYDANHEMIERLRAMELDNREKCSYSMLMPYIEKSKKIK